MNKLFVGLLASMLLPTTVFATTSHPGVDYEVKSVNGLSMHVITVDTSDSTLGLGLKLADDSIGSTSSFSSIVAQEDAIVSVNANFFESYSTNVPIGNYIIDGELVYGASGMPNMGFTEEGTLHFGTPGYFIYLDLSKSGSQLGSFLAYDVNIAGQYEGLLRLYTSEYGQTFEITCPGNVHYIENDIYVKSKFVSLGDVVSIPNNGKVVYQSAGAESWAYPENLDNCIGASAETRTKLVTNSSAFDGYTMQGLMAGNSFLIVDGSTDSAMTTYPSSEANDVRWTGSASRTAVGETSDGSLMIVQTTASLQALAEAMLSLGCVNAINIDGGASSAVAVDGSIKVSAGRELACTFHVYDLRDSSTETTPEIPSDTTDVTAQWTAEALFSLGENGILRGDGVDFNLSGVVTRDQAATMLVRILGVETEALEQNYSHPFTDVSFSNWASPYVGYLYQNSLTSGTSATTYNPSGSISANEFITFLLRAGGYSEVESSAYTTGGDTFNYATAMAYAQDKFSINPSSTYQELNQNSRTFLRSDMSILSYNFLAIPYYNSDKTIAGRLVDYGVLSLEEIENVSLKATVS